MIFRKNTNRHIRPITTCTVSRLPWCQYRTIFWGQWIANAVVLVMLDLSTAFDTINHEVSLERLSENIRISGIALQWFRSYLTDRQQFIWVQSNISTSVSLTRGVPQGSAVGSLLFSIYAAPVINLFDYMVNHTTLILMTQNLLSRWKLTREVWELLRVLNNVFSKSGSGWTLTSWNLTMRKRD